MTQAEALNLLKMGHNVFLTGPAGSGKTYVLNQYINYLKDHEVEAGITASTGIAASLLGGMTIHAWSGLGVRSFLTDYDLDDLEERAYLRKRLAGAKVLIIDEISMLHHFRLDLVDQIARQLRRNQEPFGGLQLVLCGDFFQLPPVMRNGELPPADLFGDTPKTFFAYHSPAWKGSNLKICYLEEQHRQSDSTYLQVLNAIRSGNVSPDIRAHLERRKLLTDENKKLLCTKLYSHNINVDAENDAELSKIPGQIFEYGMISRGRPALAEALKKSCLSPENLRLKKGARVMFVKNNYDLGFVNGTLGIVEFCDQNGISVRTVNGKLIDVPMASWVVEEEGKIKAEITQYPLRLAWAITVHKSQGMSLDYAEVDLSRSFEPGMGYVALSRVRSLDGLSLLGLNEMALRVNDEVLEWDEHFADMSAKQAEELRRAHPETIKEKQKDWLEQIAPKNSIGKKGKKSSGCHSREGGNLVRLPTHHQTKLLIEADKSLKEIAMERGLSPDTIINHCEKIKDEYPKFDFRPFLKNSGLSLARQLKIRLALQKGGMEAGHYRLTPAKDLLGSKFSFEEIRLVRLTL